MLKEIVIVVTALQLVFGASLIPCPDTCTCEVHDEKFDVECTNFEFISKLIPKQYSAIVKLKVSNSSIETVNPKLKYLKNLEYLDVSYNSVNLLSFPSLPKLKTLILKENNLKNIRLSTLPPNLEELDLSQNYIAQLPRDWRSLNQLKTISLTKNPIDCDCDNLVVYEDIVKHGIQIPGPLKCQTPKESYGKAVETIKCSPLDIMLADETEGSGEGEDPATNVDDNVPLINEEIPEKVSSENESESNSSSSEEGVDNNVEVFDNVNIEQKNEKMANGEKEDDDEHQDSQEFLKVNDENNENNATNNEEVEGSGNEEGSGDILIMPDFVEPCSINCTTNEPIGSNDEKDDSPLPPLNEQVGILTQDLFNFDETTTTTATTTTEVTTPVEEVEILKETEPKLEKKSDKVLFALNKNEEEVASDNLERASITNEGRNNTIYIIVGIVALTIVCILIYIYNKKKGKKDARNRRMDLPTENYGEELKPLGKQTIQPLNEKIKSHLPENIPLMNGQNGKIVDEIPKTHAIPEPQVEEPEIPEDSEEEVEIRPKPAELLTPHTERVTIKETELPDSIPRTPLLVHREKNSDGQFVITPVGN